MTKNWFKTFRRFTPRPRTTTRPAAARLRCNLETLERREVPAAFTPGNIILYRIGDTSATLSGTLGNPIFIDEYKTDGTPVQTIALPTSGAGQIISNGTSTSEGQMQLSGDGKYVSIPGYNIALNSNATTVTLNNLNTATAPRAVAVMDSTGVVINYSSLTDVTGALRSAVTNNGSDIYFSSSAVGVRFAKGGDTTSTLLGSPPTNTRNIQIFGGQLYVTSMSGSTRFASVGTGVPTTTLNTITNLPGIANWTSPNNYSPYGMFFCDLDATVPGVDTAYFMDDSSTTVSFEGLNKLTKDLAGNWSFTGTPATISFGSGTGLRGLTGSVNGSTVTLFGTYANGSTSNPDSGIVTLVDSSGFGNGITTSFTNLVTAPAGAFKTAFRGITFAPNNVQPNVTSVVSTSPSPTGASTVSYTVGFSTLVNTLTAGNLGLTTTGDVTGSIGTPTTVDGGNNWTVPITGIGGDGTLRLDVSSTAGLSPTPGSVPFTTGTVIIIDHANPNFDLLDVQPGGKAVFYGRTGKNNDVKIDIVGGKYEISDSLETISLTAAAISAGWTGSGTNKVTSNGIDTVTNSMKLNLGAGNDSIEIRATEDPLTVLGGGDSGDIATFPVNITFAGTASVTGFSSIDSAAGVTVAIDSVTLGATSIGTATTVPINTKSNNVTATAGSGGMHVIEADGADFTFAASGGGSVTIANSAGTLNIAGASTFDTGSVTLTSDDAVTVNANVGTAFSEGSISIAANTDGAGSEGYTQSTTARLDTTKSGGFSITVNTGGGGTGDAVLGQGRTDSAGSTNINSNAGSILWNPGFVIPALNVANAQLLISGNFTLQTSGAASAIGSSASPLQLNCNQAIGLTSATAGTGGVYITRYGIGLAQFTATSTGASTIQLWAGNGNNTGIEVVGAGVNITGSTSASHISIRTDDSLFLNAPIGDGSYAGTVLAQANLDGGSTQTIVMSSSNAITTSNTSASAVILRASPASGDATFGVGTMSVGNITTGNGGTVTVDAAYILGIGNDSIRLGAMNRLSGTKIDTGTGTVIFNAKGDHIGTLANPMTVTAANVVATTTSTNLKFTDATVTVSGPLQQDGDIFVVGTTATAFTATTTTAVSVDTATVTRVGDISLSTQTGLLSINGTTKNDTGDITLDGANGIALAANLGGGTTGTITLTSAAAAINQSAGNVDTAGLLTLNAAGQIATFTTSGNKAASFVIPTGNTAIVDGTFAASGAVQVDGTLGGKGSVGTVTVSSTGKVTPGTSPGKLSTGNIVFNATSDFSIEVNGNVAGTSYDQLAVTGTVDLGGATLTRTGTYTPGSGEILKIIDNDGTGDAVTGTFNGLAEGATVTINAVNYTISYVGGDGNDVTLKAPGVAAPPIVNSVILSDGTNVAVTHRSLIKQIIVTFSESVNFAGPVVNAFTLFRSLASTSAGTNTNVGIVATPATGPASSVTITFSGAQEEFGSLVDGIYDFKIDATKVSGTGGALDGDLIGGAGGDYVVTGSLANKWFRYFGDFANDQTPSPPPPPLGPADGALTQYIDFIEFRNAFTSPSVIFDWDNSGTVDQPDFIKFRNNFGGAP